MNKMISTVLAAGLLALGSPAAASRRLGDQTNRRRDGVGRHPRGRVRQTSSGTQRSCGATTASR